MAVIGVEPIDRIVGFPSQLHELLEHAKVHGFEGIVSWLPCGKAMRVHRPKEFERQIMPKYFKQTRYKSFLKQLNLYRFHRISHNEDYRGGYRHDYFQRGRLDICKHIYRTRIAPSPRKAGQQSRATTELVATSRNTSPKSSLPKKINVHIGAQSLFLELITSASRKIPQDIVDEIIATFKTTKPTDGLQSSSINMSQQIPER
jgi:hypothetical protein